jgi:hypothetical protein
VGTTDVNILLLLWDFNQNWTVLTNFPETLELAISCTSVTKSSSCLMELERQYNKTNSTFLQLAALMHHRPMTKQN